MAVNFAVALASVPIQVHYLGKTGLGVWLLLMNMWAFLLLLDLGVSQSLARHVADDLVKKDISSLGKTVSTSLAMYLALALAALSIYVVLTLNLDRFFNIPPEYLDSATWAMLPLCAVTVFGLPAKIFEALLFAKEELYIYQSVVMTTVVARLGMIWLFLHQGWGLLGVGLSFALAGFSEFALTGYFSLRGMHASGWLRVSWDWSRAGKMIIYARDALLIQLGLIARAQLPVLMLGILSTPVALAYFGVAMRLTTHALGLSTVLTRAVQPKLSLLKAGAMDEDMVRLLKRSTLYASYFAGFLGLGLFFLSEPFLVLWLGEGFSQSAKVVRLLVIPLVMLMSLGPSEAVLFSIRRHGFTGMLNLVEIAVMGLLILGLVKERGDTGAAIGLGLSLFMLRPWLLPWYVCRKTGLRLAEFWLQGILRAWLPLLLIAPLMGVLLHFWPVQGWLGFVAVCLGLALVCGLVFVFGVMGPVERAFWLQKISFLKKSKK
jgi:O-antigen/teichoic acid export membrane protein